MTFVRYFAGLQTQESAAHSIKSAHAQPDARSHCQSHAPLPLRSPRAPCTPSEGWRPSRATPAPHSQAWLLGHPEAAARRCRRTCGLCPRTGRTPSPTQPPRREVRPFVALQTHAHQLTPSSCLMAALLELADANGLQRGVATYPECESVEMFMFNYPQARRGPRLLAAKRRGVDLAASPCPPDARAARLSVAAPPVRGAAGAVAATRPGSLPAARGAPRLGHARAFLLSDASVTLLRRVCGWLSAR